MRELISCWQNTRALVLIALCAALYVAVLIPFKLLVIVPGITEVRPAAILPVVFSLLFGPIAAWGAAFGNLTGDVFGGTIGPGSLFGFLANLVYGYAPYRILQTFLRPEQRIFSARGWLALIFSILVSSALCASIVALGVDFLKIVPYTFLVHAIFLNNFLLSIILVPLLIRLLQPRIARMKLGYRELLGPEQMSRLLLGRAGVFVLLALLLFIYAAMWRPAILASLPGGMAGNARLFALGSSLLLFVASLLLL